MRRDYFEFGIIVGQKLEEFNNRIDGLSSEIKCIKELIEKRSLEVKHLKAPVEEETIERAVRVEDTEIKSDIYERALAIVQYHAEKNQQLPEDEEIMKIVHGPLELFGASLKERNAMMLGLLLKSMIKSDVLTELLREKGVNLEDEAIKEELERRVRDDLRRLATSKALEIHRDLNKVISLRNIGKYSEALSLCNSVVEKDPFNTEALFNRCILLMRLKRYKDAINCFKEIKETDSGYLEACLMKGVAYQGLNNAKKEEECYDEALRIDPTYGKALFNKAILFKEKGEFEDAERYYNEAIKADPTLESYRKEFIFK